MLSPVTHPMISPSRFPQICLPVFSAALTLLLGAPLVTPTPAAAAPAAKVLPIGSLSQIEGDATCSSTFRTGGLLAYAETASYRIYICADRNDETQPTYYRSFDKKGSGSLTLAAVDYNPQKPGAYEFRNQGYLYTVQIPSAKTPAPVLRVTLPTGKPYEEKILRFLGAPSVQSGRPTPKQEILSYFDRNRTKLGLCKDNPQPEAAAYSEVTKVGDRRYLVQFQCFLGAYQGGYEFYLYSATPQVRVQPLTLRRYTFGAGTWSQERAIGGLTNFDAQKQQLSIFSKSRGPGDCGSFSRYKLEGNTLKLQEYRVKEACDGNFVDPEKYPKIYP
jgi:Protein of unknown function (DUF1176)